MRTTITLEADVAAAVDKLRRAETIDTSEAVNRLIRDGLLSKRPRKPYAHRTANLGLRVDVSNVGEVLELLDETDGTEPTGAAGDSKIRQ